jgi:transposase-like protein
MPRKAMTKEAKIKRALDNGIAIHEIARRYNTSPQYVNLIKRKHWRVDKRPGPQPHEHIVGPLPDAPELPTIPHDLQPPAKEEPYLDTEKLFASGIVTLKPEPDLFPPPVGIMAIPPGAGEVRELEGPPKPTLWQRFKLWVRGWA